MGLVIALIFIPSVILTCMGLIFSYQFTAWVLIIPYAVIVFVMDIIYLFKKITHKNKDNNLPSIKEETEC